MLLGGATGGATVTSAYTSGQLRQTHQRLQQDATRWQRRGARHSLYAPIQAHKSPSLRKLHEASLVQAYSETKVAPIAEHLADSGRTQVRPAQPRHQLRQ
jgi:hypothetical protein